MISVVVWKEYREQRSIWLVLSILAAGVLIGVPTIFADEFAFTESREPIAFIGVILTWVYGMVCGAMLLAGERESGTESFLDALPGGRRRLWVGKCVAGLVLVGAYTILVGVLVAAAALVERPQWVFGSLLLCASGIIGLGWGLYLSAYAKTVLGAIGLAFAGQFAFNQVISAIGFVLVSLSHLLFGPLRVGLGLRRGGS